MIEFPCDVRDSQIAHVAREAAIAHALQHVNIVATYATEVYGADENGQLVAADSMEVAVYRIYLVQVLLN
jgi:hypothetical protein